VQFLLQWKQKCKECSKPSLWYLIVPYDNFVLTNGVAKQRLVEHLQWLSGMPPNTLHGTMNSKKQFGF
jgi:hypothetical protein